MRKQIMISLILVLLGSRTALPYAFTKIVDTSGVFSGDFFSAGDFSINNVGTVTFQILKTSNIGVGPRPEEAIFTGNGGAVTLVVDNKSRFTEIGPPFINDAGIIAFVGLDNTKRGTAGVFTANGAPATAITPLFYNVHTCCGEPSINNAGMVAFEASDAIGRSTIFRASGNQLTTIAKSDGFFKTFQREGRFVSINNTGTVAFGADLTRPNPFDLGFRVGIFTGSGGPTTTIADTTSSGSLFNFVGSPSINDAGTVAFTAEMKPISSGNITSIFTSSNGLLTRVVDTSASFSFFSSLAINAPGTVAFQANLTAGGSGIFTGPDPLSNKVIRTGDPLGGSTVAGLMFSRSLNDRGQIAFFANLADGTQGIYRADPSIIGPAHSFEEVVSNSVKTMLVTRKFDVNGEERAGLFLEADFKPNFDFTLEQAAQLGGYDHFNWLSVVTKDPLLENPGPGPFPECTSLTRDSFDCLTDVHGNLPRPPYFDPVRGGYKYQTVDFGHPFPVRDDLPWYLDEQFTKDGKRVTPGSGLKTVLVANTLDSNGGSSADTLQFFAAPTGPIEFLTELVGVFPDGSGQLLNEPNTIFRWKVSGDGMIKVLDNFDPSIVPDATPQILGFITLADFTSDELNLLTQEGISIRGVPEPHTFLLLASGLAFLFGTRWIGARKRKTRHRRFVG